MAPSQTVTVDKSYFDALLRRADFHTSGRAPGSTSTFANVTISRPEYDSLLRSQHEFQLLKEALYAGGITPDTLATLLSQMHSDEKRKGSGLSCPWTDDAADSVVFAQSPPPAHTLIKPSITPPFNGMDWRAGSEPQDQTHTNYNGITIEDRSSLSFQRQHDAPSFHRQPSYGWTGMTGTSSPEEFGDEGDEGPEKEDHDHHNRSHNGPDNRSRDGEPRTLYFYGFNDGTSHRDLLSIVKGGKVLHMHMLSERSATVSFVYSASAVNFLAWAKRNDIYLNNKRVDVRWADKQFHLNSHNAIKIRNGATRNLIIHNALDKGLTAPQIRNDMEHIHNLIIVDIKYQGSDAYVSTNAVHNALFARTCMLSRTTYRGCKVEFYRDECDTPLPERTRTIAVSKPAPIPKVTTAYNRFGLLHIDGTEADSDEENKMPADEDEEKNSSSELTSHHGVNLRFLDTESNM